MKQLTAEHLAAKFQEVREGITIEHSNVTMPIHSLMPCLSSTDAASEIIESLLCGTRG